jgi:hypothetical protein
MEELSAAFEGCFRFMPVSELDEIPRYAGQYFGIPCVHGDVIFDPNSPDACHVNPRFNRDHESRFESRFLPPRDARIFMYFQAQSVPRAMGEKPVQFVPSQDLPRSSIHISAGDSGSYCRYRRVLRFQDRLIPLFHTRRSSANVHCARDVAAIVREYSTQV